MKNDNSLDLLRQDGYTYFAFISYRRTDSAWAAWLKRRLQSYRLPQRTYKKHQELPPRFSSVFLDKTHLTPGLLDEGLREEVQASKYLIVICSRSAREKPEYLDAEIRYFLEGGGDASRIIPFIVDDAPRPEAECFPPHLQALCEEQTILGANVHDSGRRSAFLKVVAYMHGLKLEEIESDDQRRRRRRIITAAAAGLAVLCAAVFVGYRVWDYNRLKTNYYLDYAERWGIPEGIEPLSGETLEGAGSRYAIVTSRNKVRELRYEDSYGRLLSHRGMADHDRPTRAVYEYAEGDTLDKVSWYDTEGELVLVLNYANQQTVDLQSDLGDAYFSASMRAQNPLVESGASPVLKNVTRWLLDYDENGCLTELRYVSNPAYNDAASDPDGIGGMRYERDALGRVSRLWYLTCVGERGSARYAEDYEIIGMKNGVAGMEFCYNERNELAEYTYLNASGEPIRCSRGYASVKLDYDEHHNPTENRYYNTQDEPVYQAGGFAVYALEYDGRGNRTGSHFYGLDGEPSVNSDGYAAAKAVYDGSGNMIEGYFYGTDGTPAASVWGYAAYKMEYDADGYVLRETWYDADGAPTAGEEGACVQTWQYDADGRVAQTAFFDADGQPCLTRDGYSAFSMDYDEMGNLERVCYSGTDGAPICTAYGFAELQRGYDERGDLVSERYFGTKREPVLCADGYAAVSFAYDDAGNVLESAYYGADGEPVLLPAGYALMRANYDRRGNRTEIGYYDTDGLLTALPDGRSLVRFAYDERGNILRQSCFGTDSRPTLCGDGYSAVEYQYDDNGQLIEEAFLDTEDRPILCANGYAYALYVYDDAGRIMREAFFDAAEQLILCSSGYAYCNWFYGESGQLIQVDFYDTEGSYLGSQTDFSD